MVTVVVVLMSFKKIVYTNFHCYVSNRVIFNNIGSLTSKNILFIITTVIISIIAY